MSESPELRLLKLRVSMARAWVRESPLGRTATMIGMFLMIYLVFGVMVISLMLLMNINPTLVISVVAAPLWMAVMWTAFKVARILVPKKTADEHEEGGIGA